MQAKNFLDTAVPTPFGWVITTQQDFDLTTMLAFRNQLLSLSRGAGTKTSVPAEAKQEVPVLISNPAA